MDFCNNGSGGFTSSLISSSGGGSDPDVTKWGARRLNLSIYDIQQTIQEGRLQGAGVWDIDGNKMIRMNN